MGASKSKSMLLSEVKSAPAAEIESREKLAKQNNECEDLTTRLDEQKQKYESKYLELELRYSNLQERFLELKSKFESEELSSGDFTSRADELNQKLCDALKERDYIKGEYQKRVDEMISSQKNVENGIRASVQNKLNLVEASYREKIQRLEMEQQALFKEKVERDAEMSQIRAEKQDSKNKFEAEKLKLEEEYTRKGLQLCARFEEEKSQLNHQWELKLNDVMKNCSEEVSNFRTTLIQENASLHEKLNTALNDIDALSRKFEEIRSRYERRESRKEDLERIADLEGQLIVQSEEMERQRSILKTLKFATQPAGGTSRRSRKNSRKQQNKCNNTQNENHNDFSVHKKQNMTN